MKPTIAIVGRPNAGKSTLINRFLGEDRLLTGPEAGITRDSISVEWDWKGRTIKMFDTARTRRKARVQEKLDKLSVADGLRAAGLGRMLMSALIDRARGDGLHVMVGVLDAANEASLAFHERLGFVEVGRMPEVGRKFARWLDVIFVQLML